MKEISILIIVTGILVSFFLIGCAMTKEYYQNKSIEHQCAEYNRTTGMFQWIK